MPGLNPTQQNIDQFVAITQASSEDAQHFLAAGVTLKGAIEDFFAAQTAGGAPQAEGEQDVNDEDELDDDFLEEAMSDPNAGQQGPAGQGGAGQPRAQAYTLDGRPVDSSLPAGWAQPARNMLGRVGQWGGGGGRGGSGGMATLGSLRDSSNSQRAAGGRDQDPNEFYTGGEHSGLAVQAPDNRGARGGQPRGVVDDILRQAAEHGPIQPRETALPSFFGGAGHTLGSDETPGTTIADPNDDEEELEEAIRHVTFWRDGFSIEGGELFRYDAPGTSEMLAAIQAGRAPLALFNVAYNQPLQLVVAERRSEDYKPPLKGPAKPFSGGGNRLGSPAPAVTGNSGRNSPSMPGSLSSSAVQAAPAAASSSAPASSPSAFAVNESKPATSIQVRLGDGTRLVARVNLTHTVADLRGFVAAARPDNRPFILQTTFPSRELSDDAETVEAAKLQNAVVVQRFV
ncbi:protein phosphatase regulator [Cryptotrichosporon argae]